MPNMASPTAPAASSRRSACWPRAAPATIDARAANDASTPQTTPMAYPPIKGRGCEERERGMAKMVRVARLALQRVARPMLSRLVVEEPHRELGLQGSRICSRK